MSEDKKQENTTSISLSIAQAIANVKKISERIIGYVPYDYHFICEEYEGTSVRPAKITPLERAIVGILRIDGHQDNVTIGNILGLDVLHDAAECEILNDAIANMRKYGVLEGDDSYMNLTERGNIFASTGERPETYTGSFTLWVDPKHPNFTGLKDCLKEDAVKDIDEDIKIELSKDAIKSFAEQQASNFQNEKLRYVLSYALYKSSKAKQYKIYVCFLQSVRNDSISTFVYDANQNSLLPSLSEVIEDDQELKQVLFDKCIASECENEEAEILADSTVKPQEQNEAERQLIVDEESKNKSQDVNITVGNMAQDGHLHKMSLYDSLSFEAELHNIFTIDNADEIWMISPWIGPAFVHQRLPYIKNFIKSGKKIFIAYSQNENNSNANSNREMIKLDAQQVISELESTYPSQFFCVQLPVFHTKNVIEKKGEQCVMFTGSFNVLSFSVNSGLKQIRREEMSLVHHQTAINRYKDYLKAFIKSYIEKTINDLSSFEKDDKDDLIVNYKPTSLETLIGLSGDREKYIDFFNEIESKQLLAKNALWVKDIDKLQEDLKPFFNAYKIPSKERYTINKKIESLVRRYVNLTVSQDEKDRLDSLYTKFKELPVGKVSLRGNDDNENAKMKPMHSSTINSDVYDKMKAILKGKKRGRIIQANDIAIAKKLSGPENRLNSERDLIELLVSLNLLCTAVRIGIEKKMKIQDVYNSLKRIVKKRDNFANLSIFLNEYEGKKFLLFDIYEVQFSFENVELSDEQLSDIENRNNRTNVWNKTLPYLHTCELLDIIANK